MANAAGGGAVDLTPGETVIVYSDTDQSITFDTTNSTGGFTATGLGGADTDKLVEPGEMYEIKVIGMVDILTTNLLKDKPFTLELKPPVGAVMHIERRTPIVLDAYNDLG